MSNHSVIEHRANYHFAKLEEDYLAVCSTGKTSPHCKALILSILECWTNSKRDKGEGEYVFMTVPQWIKYTYMLYERNMITACMRELMEEGLIERRAIVMYNQKTFEYKLCVEQVQARIKALPEKTAKDTLPNLIAYITYQEKCKEKNRAAREEKKVRDLSPTHSDSDKSQGVRDNSPTVGDKSTGGYVINQRNLESITKLPLTSNQRESDAPTDTQPAPLSDIAIAHPTPLPVSVSLDDENAHDEADRAVIAHMLSQQGNPNSVFYMPPAPTQAVPALVADIAAPQEANAVTVTTEPLPHNPIAATNAPKSPKVKQDAAQPPLLTVTLTEPTMNAEWSAETCVQYVEWKNKKRYDDLKRMKQLDAARTAKRVDPTLTLARFQLAYDDWFVWWKDKKKGSLHVSDMNVKQENTFTRLENALNRIDDESERRDKRKTFSVIAGNKPAQVQQPPKKEQSQEDMDAAKAAYERMMARKQQAVAK